MNKPSLKLGFSRLFNSRGFGLMEVMVSAGIVGVLVMAVVSQQKVSVKSTATISTDTTMNDVIRRAIGEISDQNTCTKNFGTKTQVGTYANLINGASGLPFLAVNTVYGTGGSAINDNKTIVGEVQLSGIETLATNPASPYAMILRLKFKRKGVGAGGAFDLLNREVVRDIPINTVVTAGTISSCFGDYNLLAKSAVESACLSVTTDSAALMNVARYEQPSDAWPYGRCVHTQEDMTCGAGAFLKRVRVDTTTVPGKSIMKFECVDVSNTCPVGQYITEFKTDGSVTCKPALPACAAGEFIVKNSAGVYVCKSINCTGKNPIAAFGGFDANGEPICNPVTTVKDCGTNNFATTVTAGGTITCNPMQVGSLSCPAGYRVNGIDAYGNPTCAKYIELPINCGGGNVLKSIDANGNPVCEVKQVPMACDGTRKVHSQIDCAAAGGSVQGANTPNSRCLFNYMSSCPGGWTRCYQWGGQANGTCNDTSNTYYCSGNAISRTITNGGGAEVNDGFKTVTCYSWNGASNNNKACTPVPYTTASTTQSSVGCY